MAEVKAVSRIEAILNGDNVTPVSRTEAILNGDDVKPVSRGEYFLKKSASGGGSGGAGYTVETQAVEVVPEQSVTTEAIGEGVPFVSGQINLAEGVASLDDVPDTLTIVFNGTEYKCEANTRNDNKVYGGIGQTGPDFSQYPFMLMIGPGIEGGLYGKIYTESAGTYTVKAEGVLETVTVSEDFTKAIVKAVGIPEYTIDDVGEVLMVATDFKTVDTIPEQSVTILAGTSRANLSDVSGLSDTLYINGEPTQYSIYGAYQYSNYWFKIDRSASPVTIIYGIVTGKDESSTKFEETNADEDITITIRGTGSVQVPVLRWTKTSNSSSDGGQSASITPDDGKSGD